MSITVQLRFEVAVRAACRHYAVSEDRFPLVCGVSSADGWVVRKRVFGDKSESAKVLLNKLTWH